MGKRTPCFLGEGHYLKVKDSFKHVHAAELV